MEVDYVIWNGARHREEKVWVRREELLVQTGEWIPARERFGRSDRCRFLIEVGSCPRLK